MKTSFAIFVIMITSFSVYGAPEKKCPPKNPNDPFAITARMSAGPHKGECINTDRYRSSTKLSPERMEQFLTPDEITKLREMGLDIHDATLEMMANFAGSDPQKNEHFFVAIIPVERVQNAVIELTHLQDIPFYTIHHGKIEYTPYTIYHGQIRLNISKAGRPVVTIDQIRDLNRKMAIVKDDIIVTISGVRPIQHEEPYNPVKGLLPGYYGEEYQIGTVENLSLNWIKSKKPNLKMDEYTLNVTTDQARMALRIGAYISTINSITSPYSTLTSSCLNVAFLILHDTVGTSDTGDWRKIGQSLLPEKALKKIGLINQDGSSYLHTLP